MLERPNSSSKGWRVAWPWGRAGPGVGVQGPISHSIPTWQLLAGHQAGGEGCMPSWWPMAGSLWGVQQCPAAPRASGAQLGRSCCGWDTGTGDLWGSLPVGGTQRSLLSEQRVTAPPEGDSAHPRELRIDQDHPLELPGTFHCCVGA